ncbi:polygalacturonase-like [Curcuma longa]|uniref:polygalacturonase-like n=1 Tax=Curcuma longa TaxID=136217 RepID=UPI003D9EE43F
MMPSLTHKLACLILCILLLSKLHHCFEEEEAKAARSVFLEDHQAIPLHGLWSAYAKFFKIIAGKKLQAQEVLNIDAYGANSQGYLKAWKAVCSSSTPAILMVPEKKNYVLEPITFSGPCKSSVTVMIKGSVEAPVDRSAWTDRKHWIMFSGVDNLSVGGGGVIDGNGNVWWQNSCKIKKSSPCVDAPTALTFNGCKNLRVENLRIQDSQQIHVSFQSCSGVDVSHLSITAPATSPNTDGIHVTGTQSITISDSVIATGDDCISIVSGSANVMAKNIVCGPGHGISIGSLGGGNSKAIVSNVTVDTARLSGTTNGVRIKTYQGGSGYAKNIVFKNIVMQNVKNPIIIDQNYCDSKKPCQEQASAVEVGQVLYKNITGTSASEVAIDLSCSKAAPCQGIVLQDIDLSHQGSTKSFCENAKWSKLGTVVPSPCTN